MQQAFPGIAPSQVEICLTSAAATDLFTGAVYNDTWGWGKLRILNAIRTATGVEAMADGRRAPELLLEQNYPNPFNPSTTIDFSIPSDERVSLQIFSTTGRLIRTLINQNYSAGRHSVKWDGRNNWGRNVSSGMYIYRIKAGKYTKTMKMKLLR